MLRHVPGRAFPPYAFVPGQSPHPRRSPQGHSYGRPEPPAQTLDPQRWRECEPYLFGIDLFNHGFCWEAHEVWEALWRTTDRSGAIAPLLQGLIRLAAAAVKLRQGNPQSAQRHQEAARQLFQQAQQRSAAHILCGLSLSPLPCSVLTILDDPETAG